ncbi:MAG: PAS domain S-box protein [Planctomycetota bacterium]
MILALSLAVHLASLVLGSTVYVDWRCENYPIHAAVEMAGALIAVVVAYLLMSLDRRGQGTSFNAPIASALIGMGILDGMHALVHAGNSFVFLHSFASFVGGLLFACVWLPMSWKPRHMKLWSWTTLFVVLAVSFASIALPDSIPVMVRDGAFTATSVFLNIAGGVLMLVAAGRLVLEYRKTRNVDDVLFCLHCALFGAAAIMFEQSVLWDFAWWGWHALRLLAYGVALWFIVISEDRTVLEMISRERRQQLMRAAIDSASESMLTISAAGRIVDVNQATCRRLSYSREEMLTMDIWDISSELSTDQWKECWRRGDQQECQLFEDWYQTRSGEVFPVEVSGVRVECQDEEFVCYFARDFSARVAAEDALRESAVKTRAILNATSDGVLTTDHRGIIETANAAAEGIFGYTAAELHGRNVSLLMPGPLRQKHDETLKRLELTSEAVSLHHREVVGLKKDGTEFPLELSVSEVKLGDRRLFTGSLRDITERKRAVSQLRQFKTTLDRLTDSIFVFDSQTLKFVYVNRGAMQQVGYTEDELGQMTPLDIKPDFSETDFRAMIQPLKRCEEKVIQFETDHLHKDGHRIPVEVYLHYLTEEDGSARFVATVRDITERRRYEAALQEAKLAAEDACQAKSEFLAVMSHELRTPLNGVIGMAELLSGTEVTSQQKQYIDACRKSGEALLKLINRILDFSKIEAHKLELDPHAFELAPFIADTINALRWQAGAKGLAFPWQIDDSARCRLCGDSSRVRQVLSNLIGNAIKFTESGSVSVSVCTLSQSECDIRLRFEVSDTGTGIPADRQGHIFDSFSQVDSSTTRRFGGTGLGLSICRSLVELMGGEIGVESEEGVGSTFWFEIPFGLAPEACLPKVSEPSDVEQPIAGHVLLAEDNEINQLYAGELLKSLGCTCDTVFDGSKAVEAVQQRRYDLVLMDCRMPEMDGFEATRRIRELEAQGLLDGHLPIIALTANAINGDRERCLDSGMDEYLSKPFKVENVAAVLRAFVSSQSDTASRLACSHADSSVAEPDASVIDVDALIERCIGNVAFAESLLDELENTGQTQVDEIQSSVRQKNVESATAGAHSLKGAAGILCANQLRSISSELEQAGRSGQLEDMEGMIADLSAEMNRCLSSLPDIRVELQRAHQRRDS